MINSLHLRNARYAGHFERSNVALELISLEPYSKYIIETLTY